MLLAVLPEPNKGPRRWKEQRRTGDKVDAGGQPRKNTVCIIVDKEYDSDPLGERLLKWGIELICP